MRERRYLLARLPEGVTSSKDILDRYVTGTRLRLREVREGDGTVTRKLRKRRHTVHRDVLLVAIDEHADGTLIAEIDDHD